MRKPVLLAPGLALVVAAGLTPPVAAQSTAASAKPPQIPASTGTTVPEAAAAPAAPLPAAEGVQWVRKISEDDQVRIEEVKSRGETLRVTVRLKGSGREYEIVPPSGAQDPSQRHKTPAGSALFRLLSF